MYKLALGITGSFCKHNDVLDIIKELKDDFDIYPFITDNVKNISTRFGENKAFIQKIEDISEHHVIDNLRDSEEKATNKGFDLMLILPCSASTTSKLVNGIYDNAVLLGTKALLRNNTPIVLAFSSNDGLGISGRNLFSLINMKNFYVVPFRQDDYLKKPNSLVYEKALVYKTLIEALEHKQIQPLLLEGRC